MAHFDKGPGHRGFVFGVNRYLRSTHDNTFISFTLSAASVPETPVGDKLAGTDGNLKSVTLNDSGDTVEVTAHGLVVGDKVAFGPIDTVTDITPGTVYYVKTVVDADNFTLAATPGGSVITLGDDGTADYVMTVFQSGKQIQPGTLLAKITSGDESGKVGPYDEDASDGRETEGNVVGFCDTFIPWQLKYRDVEVGVLVDGAVVQEWCFELKDGIFIPLTDTAADYCVAKKSLDIQFF